MAILFKGLMKKDIQAIKVLTETHWPAVDRLHFLIQVRVKLAESFTTKLKKKTIVKILCNVFPLYVKNCYSSKIGINYEPDPIKIL